MKNSFIFLFVIASSVHAQTPVASYSFNNGNADADVGTLDGTVYGATLTQDRFGNTNAAYNFDGDAYIDFSATDPIGNNSDVSACLWLRSETAVVVSDTVTIVSTNNQYLLSTGGETNSIGYAMAWNDGSVVSIRHTSSNLGWSEYTGFTDDDVWSHTCFTYDNTNQLIKLYLNGNAINVENTSSGSWTHVQDGFRIGNTVVVASDYGFVGDIDDLFLYNTVLSDAQVDSLYSLSDPLSIDENKNSENSSSIKIFPNPSNSWVTITFDKDATLLEIFDLSGKKVMSSNDVASGSIEFSASDFHPGNYLVKVVYEGKIENSSLIITE